MKRARSHRRRRPKTRQRLWNNIYIRIVGFLVIIVTIASFYIYQRVWVRNTLEEIEQLRDRNEKAREQVVALKSDWMAASSLANVEHLIEDFRLKMVPTTPARNFTLTPRWPRGQNRFAGLIKAFEKLKGNIPLVSPSEADASELFRKK